MFYLRQDIALRQILSAVLSTPASPHLRALMMERLVKKANKECCRLINCQNIAIVAREIANHAHKYLNQRIIEKKMIIITKFSSMRRVAVYRPTV